MRIMPKYILIIITIFLMSNINIAMAIEETKISTKTYFYGNGAIASRQNGETTYYHKDYLGSARLQTDSNGNRIFSLRQMPFGSDAQETGTSSGSENNYKFTGQ